MKAFWKWCLVLPAAFGGCAAIQIMLFGAWYLEGWTQTGLARLASYLICSGTFVFCGAKTAPKQQFTVAAVLSALVLFVRLLDIVRNGYSAWAGVCDLAMCFSMCIASSEVLRESKLGVQP